MPLIAWADWKVPRERLDQKLTQGDLRVYYTQAGENAFPADEIYHGKTISAQLVAQFASADQFYSENLGLQTPLRSARYREARSIDVHILDIGKRMGTAGDAVVKFRYQDFSPIGPALSISLSNRWRPPNSTPNHELFHLYQYGYTYFKVPWFLEGLARSMDDAFTNARVNEVPLPSNSVELEQVMNLSYGANTLWNRVMRLCDPGCRFASGKAGQPRLCGGFLVRPLLEQYQRLDRKAAFDRGIDPDNWPETEQRSSKNNPYLLSGLHKAIEANCPLVINSELSRFNNLLDTRDAR